MANYHLSREAEGDLERLYEFGVLSFGLRQADTYFDGLITRFEGIAEQPMLYPAVDEIRRGYRRSVYVTHSIYFQIAGPDVTIIRVLGQQDPATAF